MIDDAIGSENSSLIPLNFDGFWSFDTFFFIHLHSPLFVAPHTRAHTSKLHRHKIQFTLSFCLISTVCRWAAMCMCHCAFCVYTTNAHTDGHECVSPPARHFLHADFPTQYKYNVVWQRCRSNFIDLPVDWYIYSGTVWGCRVSVDRVIYFRHFATEPQCTVAIHLQRHRCTCAIRLHQLIEEKFHWHNET